MAYEVERANKARHIDKPKAPPPPPRALPKPKVAKGGPKAEGDTHKKTFDWPAKGQITSDFGPRTLGGEHETHQGVDISVPEGTPVKAAAAGKVVGAGFDPGGGGNVVTIDHGGGFVSKYMHLSKIDVKVGDTVKQGDEIAESGNTGRSTGPHLHFQLEKDGNPVNPLPHLNGQQATIDLDEAERAPAAPAAVVPAAPPGTAKAGGRAAANNATQAAFQEAPDGVAADAAPAKRPVSIESRNFLQLLQQAGISADLLAQLLALLESGQLDEKQFQALAIKVLKGEADAGDLRAMAKNAEIPNDPPARDGAADGAPAKPGEIAPNVEGTGKASAAVKDALGFRGTPYVWGGTTPKGFDCSGLVQHVFNKQGVKLPRVAKDQARAGREVGKGELQSGDLVYFQGTHGAGVSHIGVYIGDGKFVHAPKTGDVVKVSNLNDAYYQQHWGGARRVA